MPNISSIQKTAFAGATETVVAKLGEDEDLTLEIAVAAVSTLFLLQDTIERSVQNATEDDEAGAIEAFRGAILRTLRDVVRSSDLLDDEGVPVTFDDDSTAGFDTVTLYKLLTIVAEAVAGAPFVQAQLQRSTSGPNRATRRKKK